MRVDQHWKRPGEPWFEGSVHVSDPTIDLVMVFGGGSVLAEVDAVAPLRDRYPNAIMIGCSTAGEIHGIRVHDNTMVATAVAFESTSLRGHRVAIDSAEGSREAGRALVDALLSDDLVHLLVFSDGLHVNGSALVSGLTERLPHQVTVSGGLAGDGEGRGETWVLLDGPAESRAVVALGFYGSGLRVGCGSLGGWDPFGPERRITRSQGNVLHELDGQSALALYKKFLGDKASELPTSALLFPLSLRSPDGKSNGIVRTVLAVDEAAQTMTFAGDLNEGWYAQLMKANFERLIDGAMGAARICADDDSRRRPQLALLVSCVGRKLVLRQRVEEEVEAVRDVLGDDVPLAGFYSLGEISPFSTDGPCELHNQTMTITTFAES